MYYEGTSVVPCSVWSETGRPVWVRRKSRWATVFGGGFGWQSDEEPTRWQRSTAPGVGAVTGGEANGAGQI